MSFFTELKRRNVFKVGVAYAIVAWLIMQVAETFFPALHLPDWTVTFVAVLLLIGFPLALFLAWAYELTPEGIKATTSEGPAQFHTRTTGHRLNYFIMSVLALAVVYLLADKYVLDNGVRDSGLVARQEKTMSTTSGKKPVMSEQGQKTNDKGPVTKDQATPSIAVLPFKNMSSDPEQEYFADGIAEEILNSLARIHDLEVRGRTSSFYFKDKNEDLHTISNMLNVDHILEGSVRRDGDRVRITVQLINTRQDAHLWSGTYERTLKDIFSIQEDIARSVAKALEITLGVGELGRAPGMTRNMEAYDAYLAGQSLFAQYAGISQEIEKLENAVALDPDFALAWSLLARVYLEGAAGFATDTEAYRRKADVAADRAIAAAPESVPSLIAAGNRHATHHEWLAAEAVLKNAVDKAPGDYQANFSFAGEFLMVVGRPGEALEYYQKAARIEPLFAAPVMITGVAHAFRGEYDAALRQYDRADKLRGGNSSTIDFFRWIVAVSMKNRGLQEEILDKGNIKNFLPPQNQALVSTMQTLRDKPEAAVTALKGFYADPSYNKNPIAMHIIGLWAAALGDDAFALKVFQDASKLPAFSPIFMWHSPLKKMRRLPGFKQVVRNLGLVDYWRSTGKWGEFCHPVGKDDFECT